MGGSGRERERVGRGLGGGHGGGEENLTGYLQLRVTMERRGEKKSFLLVRVTRVTRVTRVSRASVFGFSGAGFYCPIETGSIGLGGGEEV